MTFMNDAEGWHDECRAIPTDRYFQRIYILPTLPGQKGSWAELSFVPWEDLQSCQQLLLPYSIKRLFWYTDCDHSRTTVSEKSQQGREKAEWFWITCSPWPGTAFSSASLLCLWYQFFPSILCYLIVLHYKCSITQGRHVISHAWLPFLHGKRWSLASKAIHHSPFLSFH